ncbi:MAG: DUF58 domain-containing protein, partial [Pseudomonadota bacterium]
MIAPTLRAILLMLSGLPVLLLIAVVAPQFWVLSTGWIFGVFGLIFADLILAGRSQQIDLKTDAPALLYIGSEDAVRFTLSFNSGPLPASLKALLETTEFISTPQPTELRRWTGRAHTWTVPLIPVRRGEAKLSKLWLSWTGPLGLTRLRKIIALDQTLTITPNTQWVREQAVRLYTRDADFGVKMQMERGDGSEFDALRDFVSGMDRRAIDWKHSARHRSLLAKEFRTERNHNIVFAFDTGRLMSEPLGGVPKIDQAINAALLLAFVSLRSGDKTALFGFDAKPTVSSNILSDIGAFPHMQRLASQLDYGSEEANYTLALSTLSSRLQRRSLIILFSDFVDTISAELMLENVRRLTDRHLVLFACFEDQPLHDLIDAEPRNANDVSRAVIADDL